MRRRWLAGVMVGMTLLAGCGTSAQSGDSGGTPTQSPTPTHPGAQWHLVANPNATPPASTLHGITAIAPNDIWAVGNGNPKRKPDQTLLLHFDGISWRVVAGPTGKDAGYTAVTASAKNDVWALGIDTGQYGAQPLLAHYDGASWKSDATPDAGQGGSLADIKDIAPNDLWAVGGQMALTDTTEIRSLIEYYDGTRWSVVPNPSGEPANCSLSRVAASSRSDVWAVGSCDVDNASGTLVSQQPLIEHYDGAHWSVVADGFAANHGLVSVAAASPHDVWVSGTDGLIAHYDGTQWQTTPVPDPQPSFPATFSAIVGTTSEAWAVGAYATAQGGVGSPHNTVAAHWDGVKWSIVPTPKDAGYISSLTGVAFLSPNNVWAVGTTLIDPVGDIQAIIEHYTS